MTRTELQQQLRRMRFEEAYGGWEERRLAQEWAFPAYGTGCLRCPEEPLEFLGYRIGHTYRRNGKGSYIGTRPSKASVQSIRRKIGEQTAARHGLGLRLSGRGSLSGVRSVGRTSAHGVPRP